jgi:hypothetical protein
MIGAASVIIFRSFRRNKAEVANARFDYVVTLQQILWTRTPAIRVMNTRPAAPAQSVNCGGIGR